MRSAAPKSLGRCFDAAAGFSFAPMRPPGCFRQACEHIASAGLAARHRRCAAQRARDRHRCHPRALGSVCSRLRSTSRCRSGTASAKRGGRDPGGCAAACVRRCRPRGHSERGHGKFRLGLDLRWLAVLYEHRRARFGEHTPRPMSCCACPCTVPIPTPSRRSTPSRTCRWSLDTLDAHATRCDTSSDCPRPRVWCC